VAGRGFAEAMVRNLRPGERLELIGFSHDDLSSLSSLLQPCLPAGTQLLLRLGLSPRQLQQSGVLHLPDPGLPRWSLLRSTSAPHAFSLTGVIHTLCSDGVVNTLEQLYSAPLHSWDALVCTSTAGQQVVQNAIDGFRERLEHRLGVALPAAPGPQLPIIPLGIDPGPFQPKASDTRQQWRLRARRALGLPADAYVVLFVGRLSFHSKAHPLVLYRSLDRLAQEMPGVVLLECGHLFNATIAEAFAELSSQMSYLQVRRVGGLTPATEEQKQLCLAAADVFCSPADNLQETFGLSLLEAMAAELPVLASDWNGYRDLVEPGVTGALVPTRASFPPDGQVDALERNYRLGLIDYDAMVGLRSLNVDVDAEALFACLRRWRERPQERQQLGRAGRHRLERQFSWTVVANQYRGLWEELELERRSAAAAEPQSTPQPGVTSYGRLFQHYPTELLQGSLPRNGLWRVPPNGTPPSWLEQPMQQAFLKRLLGDRLQPLIQHLNSYGCLTASELLSLGIAEHEQLQVLQALLKLGVLV
jgi:starch synthase